MSEKRRPSHPRGLRRSLEGGLVACALLLSTKRLLAEEARPLFEADVVRIAAEQNPQLKAALLELSSAGWDVRGLEEQYAPVLLLDLSGTQIENPTLSNSRTNTTRRADAGAELRKHTLWGTDLSLRLSGNAQKYIFNGFSAQTGTGAAGGGAPGLMGEFGPVYGLTAKLTLKQPLLRGRGRDVNEATLLASRLRRSAAEHARDRIASQTMRDALSAYWELWYARAAVDIEQRALATAQAQRDNAAARAETGSLAPADVLAFETQVATREETLLNARLTFRQREIALRERLGTEQDATAYAPEAEPVVSVPARALAEQRALAESPELRELLSSVQLAELQQKTASDPQKPRLDLDSYVQLTGQGNEDLNAAFAQVGTGNAVSAFVSLTYETPVNRTRERAEAAKGRIATEVAREKLREAKLRVTSEVASLHERSQAGEQTVELCQRTLEIARKQHAAEQARYASGASDSMQVLEAEDRVRSAELRVARARVDLMLSALSLAHYTGDLLERYAALARSR